MALPLLLILMTSTTFFSPWITTITAQRPIRLASVSLLSKAVVHSRAAVSSSASSSRRQHRCHHQQLQLVRITPVSLHGQSPATKSFAFTYYLSTDNSHHYRKTIRRLPSMPRHYSNEGGNGDSDAAAAPAAMLASPSLHPSSASSTSPPPITPYISSRTYATLDPCVILMKQLISKHAHKWERSDDETLNNDNHRGIYSLAQGVVYWPPPTSAYEALMQAAQENLKMSDSKDGGTTSIDGTDMSDGRLIHTYCPDEGYPPLLSALQRKLQQENGLSNPHVIVTSGANQAYVNCVLTLLDERPCVNNDDIHVTSEERSSRSKSNLCIDKCVVFEPYYFNHVMAIQSVRGGRGCGGMAMAADQNITQYSSTSSSSCNEEKNMMVEGLLVGPTIRGVPDLKWLRSKLDAYQYNYHDDTTNTTTTKNAIRMVTLVNPGNPTGISLPHQFLKDIVQLTKEYGVWLIMDNTYEHFDIDGENRLPPLLNGDDNDTQENPPQPDFPCFDEEHVINIFSFSKGYAMAGFRVGYIALSSKNGSNSGGNGAGAGTVAYNEMLKVQDTIAICASRISQMAAVGALQAGREWVYERVKTLDIGRAAIKKAMSSLEDVVGGNGAMYIMGKLPSGVDDRVSESKHFDREREQ